MHHAQERTHRNRYQQNNTYPQHLLQKEQDLHRRVRRQIIRVRLHKHLGLRSGCGRGRHLALVLAHIVRNIFDNNHHIQQVQQLIVVVRAE